MTTRDATPLEVAALFEGAPRFLARLAAARPFASDSDLFARARKFAHSMPEAEQLELIHAHPRLGLSPGSVSAMSYTEQGYDRGTGTPVDVAAELVRLNDAYEARLGSATACSSRVARGRPCSPGWPPRSTPTVMPSTPGLDAVVDIAIDRHAKLSAATRWTA